MYSTKMHNICIKADLINRFWGNPLICMEGSAKSYVVHFCSWYCIWAFFINIIKSILAYSPLYLHTIERVARMYFNSLCYGNIKYYGTVMTSPPPQQQSQKYIPSISPSSKPFNLYYTYSWGKKGLNKTLYKD